MKWSRLLPEMVLGRPRRPFEFRFQVGWSGGIAGADEVVPLALAAAGVHWEERGPLSWEIMVPWRAMVYGLIRRDLEERCAVNVDVHEGVGELRLRCLPAASHGAHAAGAGGVVVLAATVWLSCGLVAGIAPGLTTALAGGLWADTTRELGMQGLDRRLRRLTEDLGSAIWPRLPYQLLPAPRRW